MSKRRFRGLFVTLALFALCLAPRSSAAQVPSADSLAQWIRRGYSVAMDSAQASAPQQQVRDVWVQLGWSGVGYGFRTFAVRQAAAPAAVDQSINAFAAITEYYRVRLDELRTDVVGEIGLVWGVHTEDSK